MSDEWPELPYSAWEDTCATLQLWTQIVGKTRLALTPWVNHSWHVTLMVSARGLVTPIMHAGGRGLQVEFDFIDHALDIRASDGQSRRLMLRPMTVAEFYVKYLALLSGLGFDVTIDGSPNETAAAVHFRDDHTHASYDPEFARRFWRVLLASHDVFAYFRTAFLGKVSPVHFFWG